MITDTEKTIIRKSLRREFDNPGTSRLECEAIINIYYKLELGKDFIIEMQNDYSETFNK